MVNSFGSITASAEIQTFVANGFTSLSGAHSGQYELAFASPTPPTDFSISLGFVSLDSALGYYFVEGSHQRLVYFRGDGGGGTEGLAVVMANYPETDSRYDASTRRTVYMPPGWTFV